MSKFFTTKIKILCALVVCALLLISWARTQRAKVQPNNVVLGTPTNSVRMSWKTFRYNDKGHYGGKTQYESKASDSAGGNYTLHCRNGKVYAAEVFWGAGVAREQAIATLERLLKTKLSAQSSHDDVELKLKTCAKPSEYYYFDSGKSGAQLDYRDGASGSVSHLYCWTRS